MEEAFEFLEVTQLEWKPGSNAARDEFDREAAELARVPYSTYHIQA